MNDTIEVLARRRLALVEQRDSLDEAIKAIDSQLVDAIEVGGAVTVDGEPVFRVQQRRTFSLDKARELVPTELIEAATVPTLDAKRLRSMLPPAVESACMVEGAVYVSKAGR